MYFFIIYCHLFNKTKRLQNQLMATPYILHSTPYTPTCLYLTYQHTYIFFTRTYTLISSMSSQYILHMFSLISNTLSHFSFHFFNGRGNPWVGVLVGGSAHMAVQEREVQGLGKGWPRCSSERGWNLNCGILALFFRCLVLYGRHTVILKFEPLFNFPHLLVSRIGIPNDQNILYFPLLSIVPLESTYESHVDLS